MSFTEHVCSPCIYSKSPKPNIGLKMEFKDLQLAAYLNEAGDDPAEAAAILKKNGIQYVCLRRAWGRDIFRMTDDACGLVRDILTDNGLKPVLLASTIGDVLIQNVADQGVDLDKALMICNFLGCPAVQVSLGIAAKSDMNQKYLHRWMRIVADKCLAANIKPVFEIDYSHCISSPAEIAQILQKFGGWSLLYDPAQLIAKRKVQPFTKYWSLLRDRISHFDIHDYSSGAGPKAPGHGDAQIDLALNDAVISGFKGWYCLEPGMGRRYNDISGKAAVFEYALGGLKALFERLDMGSIQPPRHKKWHRQSQ